MPATMRIIIANEPRSYRTVLAATIQRLRPDIEVITLEPEDLDDGIIWLTPAVVLCSQLTPTVRQQAVSWVLLYPGYETRTVVNVVGQHTAGGDMGLDEVLSVIDRTQCFIPATEQSTDSRGR